MVEERIGHSVRIVADFATVERRPHALHDVRTDVRRLFRGPQRDLQQLGLARQIDPIRPDGR
jgi:hypothetical protein